MESSEEELWCPFLQQTFVPSSPSGTGKVQFPAKALRELDWTTGALTREAAMPDFGKTQSFNKPSSLFSARICCPEELSPARRSRVFSQLPVLPVWGDDVRIPSRLERAAAAIFQHISNHLPWGELIFASLEPDMNLWCWTVPFAAAPNLFWPGFCGNH